MKVLICGKGGSGKSTISSLLAKSIAEKGFNILVIDSDESNYGLHCQLGMELPDDFMNFFGGKKELGKRMMELFKKGESISIFDKRWGISDLPREYIVEKNGIKLLAIGKIHEFREGCACPMGALAKSLLDNLDVTDKEVVIVDTDAGIEHFGRGVEQGCDVILAVVEPSYESLKLAKKIEEMAKGIGKMIYFVLNKVDEDSRDMMLKSLNRSKVNVAGIIPANKDLFKACLAGEEIKVDLREIEELTNKILEVRV
ncbi:MAG: AAA family ATPase [Methanocellales archaeon]|nr:AAA family ATPase [Methanocellales archaeon]MDD3290977.1 AAA family ATPase [Methanocellales archaeon]MDD5234862.1 AAA family ATPase [Methanocellales archaeon]MDD5484768.1 AAA family ATPase [Methanocellales archaeon]